MRVTGARRQEALCVAHTAWAGPKSLEAREVGDEPSIVQTASKSSRLQGAADLRDSLAQSIVEVRTGKLDLKANSISYLGAGFMLLRYLSWKADWWRLRGKRTMVMGSLKRRVE